MTKKLTGETVIRDLQNRLGLKSLESLAGELGLTNQAVQNWKKRQHVTSRQIAGLVLKAQNRARQRAQATSIRPLVEFFPIKKSPSKQGAGFVLFSELNEEGVTHPYLAGLKMELQAHYGVYVFFDSRGQAIYAGKARLQKLWKELNLAFNREREDLQKIRRVKHPSRKYQYKTSNEKSRQIVEVSVPLHELSSYFSAYEVADGMIGVVEAMLVRSFANNLLNKKMERFGSDRQKQR